MTVVHDSLIMVCHFLGTSTSAKPKLKLRAILTTLKLCIKVKTILHYKRSPKIQVYQVSLLVLTHQMGSCVFVSK